MRVFNFRHLSLGLLTLGLFNFISLGQAEENQEELIEVSRNYIDSYIGHLDEIEVTKIERLGLSENINEVNADIRDLKLSISASNKELLKAQSDLENIPGKIANHEYEINRKDRLAKEIFNENFAGLYESPESALSGLKAQQAILIRNREDLVQERAVTKIPYERRIFNLNNQIESNSRNISRNLEPKIKNLEINIENRRKKIEDLNKELTQVENLQNQPGRLNRQIEEAQQEFRRAREAKGERNCKTNNSRPCRRFIAARKKLEGLRNIKNGKTARDLRVNIREKREIQATRRQRLRGFKNEVVNLRADNRVYNSNVAQLKRDLRSALLSIDIEIEEMDLRLTRLKPKSEKASFMMALIEDVNYRGLLVQRLKRDAVDLPFAIESLNLALNNFNESLNAVNVRLEAYELRKAELVSSLSVQRLQTLQEQMNLSDLINDLIERGEI